MWKRGEVFLGEETDLRVIACRCPDQTRCNTFSPVEASRRVGSHLLAPVTIAMILLSSPLSPFVEDDPEGILREL